MTNSKTNILDKVCYTELVYGRINKKLKTKYTEAEIEKLVIDIITDTNEDEFIKRGKNIYIRDRERNIRITVNSYTHRIITADDVTKIAL